MDEEIYQLFSNYWKAKYGSKAFRGKYLRAFNKWLKQPRAIEHVLKEHGWL
jgi:hypothetical protein